MSATEEVSETYPSWSQYLKATITPEETTMVEIESYLLDIAGDTIAGDTWDLYERTRFLDENYVIDMRSDSPVIEELDASQCHFNIARLWMSYHDEEQENWTENPYTIMTGWGLGPDDGTWRSHSWLSHMDGEILETTVPRDIYVGARLASVDEALSFCHGEDVYSQSD